MATTAHLTRLNAAQRKAVTHGEPLPEKGYRSGPLLIVAGAGTGKTDTLAYRVAHLVINGVDPAADLHAPRRDRDAPARARDHPQGAR
jgi:DNA helicase-2/ATP-dependent DNA helicase PcrA